MDVLVYLMLLTTFLTTAQNTENISVRYESEENNSILFNEGDVPVWKVGNKWIYNIDGFVIYFEKSNLIIYINITIEDLYLEVTKTTEEFYELTIKANISGYYWINLNLEQGLINISGEFTKTKIEGTITFTQIDLGIKQINIKICGKLTVKVDQPFINLSFLPKFPISATITLDLNFH